MAKMANGAQLSRAGLELLTRFLLGERVSSRELQRAGVKNVKNPLSTRNAELVLKTVLAGLRRLGLSGTLLLLDENEKTFQFKRSAPPMRVLNAANLMRRIIDSCAGGSLVSAIVVFAVLPGFVESCSLAYEALGQRLQTRRDDGHSPGWRSPVLPIEAVSSVPDPEAFLEAVTSRFEDLIVHCGGRVDGVRARFAREGKRILERSAGAGYRRALMKQLATLTLTHLEA
jgi:hypothetical protein